MCHSYEYKPYIIWRDKFNDIKLEFFRWSQQGMKGLNFTIFAKTTFLHILICLLQNVITLSNTQQGVATLTLLLIHAIFYFERSFLLLANSKLTKTKKHGYKGRENLL